MCDRVCLSIPARTAGTAAPTRPHRTHSPPMARACVNCHHLDMRRRADRRRRSTDSRGRAWTACRNTSSLTTLNLRTGRVDSRKRRCRNLRMFADHCQCAELRRNRTVFLYIIHSPIHPLDWRRHWQRQTQKRALNSAFCISTRSERRRARLAHETLVGVLAVQMARAAMHGDCLGLLPLHFSSVPWPVYPRPFAHFPLDYCSPLMVHGAVFSTVVRRRLESMGSPVLDTCMFNMLVAGEGGRGGGLAGSGSDDWDVEVYV